jgi:hypothetical protein
MTTVDDRSTAGGDDTGNKQTDIVLEYGHRYALGKAMFGVHMNWVPSVTYTMGTTAYSADGADDDKQTSLALNFANFAATF